ncbi:hypothetical protein [Pedobacter nototheniae]|uniref:hypothetical protein n=1 Tax=Pedobacter nototheniae TaxID=2488994 RepID=UPI0029309D76|nr:hypothetical protein [Pedobacter nototheniae]
MERKDFFVQKNYKMENFVGGEGYVHSHQLIDLIKNEEVKDLIVAKYELEDDTRIEFDKIDLLVPLVKKYTSRFEQIRLMATNDNVITSFDVDNDVIFTIKNAEIEGAVVDELIATGLYNSVNMFYEGRKLSQYINFLKKNVRDQHLLNAVNTSWQDHYLEKGSKLSPRLYRLLYDSVDGGYFLKSINSDKYREYGVAETFVLTILELHRISTVEGRSFNISSIALSESKIEIILPSSHQTYLKELGYIHPSIAIRNEDQGNTSIGFYSSLEFKLAHEDENGKLYFFPNKRVKDIKLDKTINHTVVPKTFVESYGSISEFFHDIDFFKEEFYFLKEATSPDSLRAKIEEKIISPRSPFRGIKELKDLFTRDKVGHLDNLSTLLKLCGKAEMIDMNYDLKFELRYIISNVLLYGKHKE